MARYPSLALAAPLLLAMSSAAPAPAAEPVRLLVPAYFYPAGEGLKQWDSLLAAAGRAPVVAIVNPDSGPGKVADENYAKLVRRARGTKAVLLGYVTLSYGKRPLSAVKADVDSWQFFYPDIGGVFFDEQPSGPDQAAFALEAFAHARRSLGGGLVVSNPGVPCAREYMAGALGPVVCLFEHHAGFEAYKPPEWAARYGPERFAVLRYQVATAAAMRPALREALRTRAGFVYITDAAGPMPWGRLPSYWAEEVAEVASLSGAPAP